MKATQYPTVGQLVAERPARSKVFEKYGIDYCCGGKKELDIACAELNIGIAAVQHALDECDQTASLDADWTKARLTELCDHIESTHHGYLRGELPALAALSGKVASVHGAHHPELVKIAQLYSGMHAELAQHMMKEEQILFPMIRELERTQAMAAFHCGSVANPIRVMEAEHDSAGNAIHEIRRLSSQFTVPADACNSYRALYQRLDEFEHDLHQHVHKENNILFPRAILLEAQLSGR